MKPVIPLEYTLFDCVSSSVTNKEDGEVFAEPGFSLGRRIFGGNFEEYSPPDENESS